MPNWCKNMLTIKSQHKPLLLDIKESVSNQNSEEGLLNCFRPMPDELKNTVKGTPIPKWQVDHSQELIEKYGADNWYDWAIAHWGTKWDVTSSHHCELDLINLDKRSWMLSIEFESAWSPPENAIEYFVQYALKHVDAVQDHEVFTEVTLQYIESGMQYCGVRDFLDESNTFFITNYMEENLPKNIEDKIWLAEEVEAEKDYQREMDEEWEEDK